MIRRRQENIRPNNAPPESLSGAVREEPVRWLRGGARKRTAFWLINLFLVVGWFVTVAQFFTMQFNISATGRVAALGLLVYPGLLVLAIRAYSQAYPTAPRYDRRMVALFLAVMGLMLMNGFAHANPIRLIYFDLITCGTLFAAFLLGRYDVVWRDIRSTVVVLTGISIVLAITFTDAEVLRDRSILNQQSGSQFEGVLTLAPLLLLVATLARRNTWYFPLLMLTAGCLLVYLYFGRRGISVRVLIELGIASIILPFLIGLTKRALLSVGLGVAFVAALLAYFPFETLLERYQGRYGVVATVVLDNERWAEARDMIQEMSAFEVIMGKGLGGSFFSNTMTAYASDDISGEEFGRLYPHVGAAMPLLKGGVFFLGLYFLPFGILFSRLGDWRALDPITLAAAAECIVLFAFLFIEGTSTYSTPWVGFGVGLVMSRIQNVQYGPAKQEAIST